MQVNAPLSSDGRGSRSFEAEDGRTDQGAAQADILPRVLWVNHFALPPSEGGGTRHFELGRELARRGWRVTVAAADFNFLSRRYIRRQHAKDHRALTEQFAGVEFRWLWTAAYVRNDWRRAVNWLSFAHSLDRSCRQGSEAPDVVVGSSPHLLAAAAAERAAHRWKVPFVLEVRDLWPESLLAVGGRKGPGYFILERIAARLYRRASLIICLAKGTMAHLEGLGVDRARLAYVPNGVDPDSFPEVERHVRPSFTVVYAGAHGPANGLDLVLDAAERLQSEPAIRFLLLGDGPAKAALVAEAGRRGLSNVEFRDPVPKTELPGLLASADAGLMVLRDAPLFAFGVSPNKLFDYFGAALPVVCNVPGEVAAWVRSAGAGEQAEAGSAVSLASAIMRLWQRGAEDRAVMGRSARQWVLSEHSRVVLGGRLDRLLRDLVEA